MTADPLDRCVVLDVADTTLRYALAFACEEAGWRPLRCARPQAWRVVDRPPGEGAASRWVDLVVVAPTALACRRALDAFTVGRVGAVASAADPHSAVRALELLREGTASMPRAMVEEAQRFPALRPRLERTLHLVVRGATIGAIAQALHQSPSSTKRDVAELLHLFDAPNRLALATTAVRLGVPPA